VAAIGCYIVFGVLGVNRALSGIGLFLSCLASLSGQARSSTVYLSYIQGSPVLEALEEPVLTPSEWPAWIAASDAATRARVTHGDETSIVNLLFFGTSFTQQPRVAAGQLNQEQVREAVRERLRDFERALGRPGRNERLEFARRTLAGGGPVRERLLSMIDDAVRENLTHAELTEQAHALNDASLEFAERSRLYRARGLSSDTSVRINFALEEALSRIKAAGHMAQVRRVGIIGPGLDFVDKQEGYDFYPPQTIQPFAVADSLARAGLADADALQVATFDVSTRVNQHISAVVQRGRDGSPYLLHLPLDGAVAWTPGMLRYFSRVGGAIGSSVSVAIPPAVGPIRLRAIAVRPSIVSRIEAHDLNITAQTLTLSDAERFDLIVGTNVFVYYDRVQQGLAMVSAAAMLRPGGMLLSNNALVEAPSAGMRSIGYSTTVYSNREQDGDLVIWYQKTAP
jgi:hypothetical protein